jgi:hypothetical protein
MSSLIINIFKNKYTHDTKIYAINQTFDSNRDDLNKVRCIQQYNRRSR